MLLQGNLTIAHETNDLDNEDGLILLCSTVKDNFIVSYACVLYIDYKSLVTERSVTMGFAHENSAPVLTSTLFQDKNLFPSYGWASKNIFVFRLNLATNFGTRWNKTQMHKA
jgi:hypothetical protein